MVIFSAGAGKQALDRLGNQDNSPNGLFTRILLKEVARGGQPIDRVLKNVRTEVVRLAKSVGHEQVPAIYDQSIGDFYFRRDGSHIGAAPESVAPTATVAKPTQPTIKAGTSFRDCPDCPEMIVVPSGQFDMESPRFEGGRQDHEGPVHRVSIPSFAMAKTELTLAHWSAFVRETGYRVRSRKCWVWEDSKMGGENRQLVQSRV